MIRTVRGLSGREQDRLADVIDAIVSVVSNFERDDDVPQKMLADFQSGGLLAYYNYDTADDAYNKGKDEYYDCWLYIDPTDYYLRLEIGSKQKTVVEDTRGNINKFMYMLININEIQQEILASLCGVRGSRRPEPPMWMQGRRR